MIFDFGRYCKQIWDLDNFSSNFANSEKNTYIFLAASRNFPFEFSAILCLNMKKPTKTFNTRMNNLYVEGFDDCVITEMINMLCKE